jgi:hypothetical protein
LRAATRELELSGVLLVREVAPVLGDQVLVDLGAAGVQHLLVPITHEKHETVTLVPAH